MASSSGQQPRRRFTGRVRAFTEQRRQEFSQAGAPILPEDQQMVLGDYLDISRRRHLTLMPLFKLQLHMLQDIVTAEQGIKQYKEKIAEMAGSESEDEADEIEGNKPTPEQSPEQQAALRSMRRELYYLKAEVRALRDIGDGIAWRLFDFDRAVLHELARRPTRHHVNPEGILAELYTFAEYVNKRHVSVLNVLTNFLKFGDVTVRRAADEFEIIEVKAGTSGGGRLTRQRQGLNEIVSLLSNDQGREIAGLPTHISSVDVVPEMFAGNLRGLLARAAADGAAVEIVGAHLLIECMDFMSVQHRRLEKDQVFAILDRGGSILTRWATAGDFVLPFDAHSRYAHAQNYAPLSIFPLEPKSCVRLVSGAASLRAFINISAVLRELEARGWTVVRSPHELAKAATASDTPERETPMAVLRKRSLTTHVPAALFGRLGMEFLKPRSMAQLLEAMFEQRREAGYQFINFAAEYKMWL